MEGLKQKGGIMEKQKEETKVMEALPDCLPELGTLKKYVKDCEYKDVDPDRDLLLFLVNAIQEKIDYFWSKYGFEIEREDQVFMENFADFIRMKEGIRKEG